MCYASRLCLLIVYVAISAVVVLGQRWVRHRQSVNARRVHVKKDTDRVDRDGLLCEC